MTKAVDQLARLLKIEHLALLKGDFDTVGALVAEKESLSTQFDDANAAELKLLSTALARNSTLFAAAHEGVTAVVTTLRQQRAARTTLSSYDSSGKATQISQPEHGTERRY
ncbi:hypothetical protein SAMN05444287_2530 [Octadecabacter temperatus]|uniref:Uncharacterized protein n=1 Tax=Octadecabacter temperatus TaxID=1458307 RepID=A0A0K0YA55_9RHOB|nr:hypothetical protein [Octadecabacter temperatus]AKS47813.1 hypothetical protein OSB_33000 [Octadecabacter temperatus]SIO38137.1 hypothetical protein SAMN05444287_2530 [Octadecabacter temperatus]